MTLVTFKRQQLSYNLFNTFSEIICEIKLKKLKKVKILDERFVFLSNVSTLKKSFKQG